MNKFVGGVTTGAIVGAAFGLMVLPHLDKKTQKAFKRAGKKVVNTAGESYVDIMRWMK